MEKNERVTPATKMTARKMTKMTKMTKATKTTLVFALKRETRDEIERKGICSLLSAESSFKPN